MEPSKVHVDGTAIFLEDHLGPQRQDLYKVIPVTVIYVIIFSTGLVGKFNDYIHVTCLRFGHFAINSINLKRC